ncbi:MAG: plasmid pRiA4b ORF-3 family protein [Alphaproteobacteria bacterium]|nr:plasmid pRiA4b ORF-3 family protein [Alphaproteobacteria bacterium]
MSGSVIRLKITLDDSEPPIWRRVELPAETDLKGLHRVIQAAMGWTNSHLHEFQVGRRRAAGRTTLAELAASGVRRFGYLYDMGDSWQHTLGIEKTLAAEPSAAYPRLVDGAGRCPPEDCGGIPGFYSFLEALADPRHPEHAELLDWHGGPFDAADLDEAGIRQRLARLATARARATVRRKLGAGKT